MALAKYLLTKLGRDGIVRPRNIRIEAITNSFFDRESVQRLIGSRVAKAMTRIGGFVRTTAKRSMRAGTKKTPYSKPGEPPRYHTKKLRDLIYFNYDRQAETLVAGPLKFNSAGPVKPTTARTVAELLEEGGDAESSEPTFIPFSIANQPKSATGQFAKKPDREFISIPAGPRKYAARPYMKPAFEKAKNAAKLQQAFEVIG